jgi:hypothetical protein
MEKISWPDPVKIIKDYTESMWTAIFNQKNVLNIWPEHNYILAHR